MELIFADLEVIERAIGKVTKSMKADKKQGVNLKTLESAKAWLEDGKPLRTLDLDEEQQEFMKGYDFLTSKPIIYAANISEDDIQSDDNKYVNAVKEYAKAEGAECVQICAEIEAEMAELDDEDRQSFLEDMGIEESGLDKLIKASYRLLDLISFITAGEPEVRAWTIKEGTKAPQAAGKIHTDFERGFIRAETISYDDLISVDGSLAKAREKGLIRSEGKDYTVKDGDVIHFLFNV